MATGNQLDAKDRDADGGGMFSAVERLIAAAAVLGGALYVLVNGLYIEFYDDFGVRPEQVGLDRLAVLARSAWVALVAVVLLAPLAYVLARGALRTTHEKIESRMEAFTTGLPDQDEQAVRDFRDHLREDPELDALFFKASQIRRSFLAVIVLIISLLIGYSVLQWRVDAEAEHVANGQDSNGIGWLVPIVDVRANRAEVSWTGSEGADPPGLENAAYLTYLGSGAGVTVLVACGTKTYIVSESDVVVTLLDQGQASDDLDNEEEEAAFQKACPNSDD